jgi:micrococcal nuclease
MHQRYSRLDGLMYFFLILLMVTLSSCHPAHAATTKAVNSIEVALVGVYDGDTVDIRYDILPAPLNKMRLRIIGIDTPERGTKASCPSEAAKADEARDALEKMLAGVKTITIANPKWDKYGGRILGNLIIISPTGTKFNVAEILINKGYAHPYDGKGQRASWCN